MIPETISERVSKRLAEECGMHVGLGEFVFWFCALPSDRDVEFALEQKAASDDEVYKRGINIVLEEVAANHAYPNHAPETAVANLRAGREVWDTNGDMW